MKIPYSIGMTAILAFLFLMMYALKLAESIIRDYIKIKKNNNANP